MDIITQIMQLCDRPSLMHPDYASRLFSLLESVQDGSDAKQASFFEFLFDKEKQADTDQGLAIIHVSGMLSHRGWGTSYVDLEAQHKDALDDTDVKAIVYDCRSFGGEASGCFEFGKLVYETRSEKPSIALVSNYASSACYLIASSCSEVVLPPTGEVGSIGVLQAHRDVSKMCKDNGVKMTYIYAGSHKVDGNPYEPLPKDVRELFQGEVDDLYRIFVSDVAKYRGMSEQAVIDTQALTYMGQNAVNVGLADRVETRSASIDRMISKISSSTLMIGDTSMKDKKDDNKANLDGDNKTPLQLAEAQIAELQTTIAGLNADLAAKTDKPASAESVMRLCGDAGFPSLAIDFVDKKHAESVVNRALGVIVAVKEQLNAADLGDKVDEIALLAGDPAKMVAAALSAQAEALEADIDNTNGADSKGGSGSEAKAPNSTDIYAKRKTKS